jgi:hypothetical protein
VKRRVAATILGTLILWFLWVFLGQLLLLWVEYSIGGPAGYVTGAIFWIAVVAIPPLLWFRFRHVQENPDR